MKTVVRGSALCFAILLIVSLTAMGADRSISVSKDGRQVTANKPASTMTPLRTDPFSGLTILYDNASSYPLGRYWCCEGWTISGTASALAFYAADAMPFTPSVDATVTHIGVGVGYVEGTNEITVSLNADSSGLPGAVLGSFNVSNLPSFGSCCVTEVESMTGVPVTAGTQYWVVVAPTSMSSTLFGAWNDNDTNETAQPFAYENSNEGSGWFATEGDLGVFGVAGTVQ
jgi:hypothetical protein